MASRRGCPTQAPGPVDCAATPCVALTFDDGPVPRPPTSWTSSPPWRAGHVLRRREAGEAVSLGPPECDPGGQRDRQPLLESRRPRTSGCGYRRQGARPHGRRQVEAATGSAPSSCALPSGRRRKAQRYGPACRRCSGRSTLATGRSGAPGGRGARARPGAAGGDRADARRARHDSGSPAGGRRRAPQEGLCPRDRLRLLGTDLTAGAIYRTGPAPTT